MNDFTKDEIIGLFYMVDTFIRYCEGGQKALVLRNKLKVMMENYCDHSNDVFPLYTKTGDLPVGYLCYDCGALVSQDNN